MHKIYLTCFRILVVGLFSFIGSTQLARSQGININYEEEKVGPYTLPDLLRLPDGSVVTNPQQWETQVRPHTLALFKEHIDRDRTYRKLM
ncbi:hypothetical protein AAE02nite_11150 [Adhaeribacter aerolatus]|uniref:Uncharacterized protein n=1 Tax=Adhaeribacter aerolatus TaxID=670289 RepID=A0A512AUR9_9BACT|nr:hypothetical protein [Adhaeribacter aerolatus]GEO03451.1 hypothetical protein AAE02nite_11150 [Adhaeribacter aerolatus]